MNVEINFRKELKMWYCDVESFVLEKETKIEERRVTKKGKEYFVHENIIEINFPQEGLKK